MPLRGLLLGSMTADLQAVAEKMSYPIILIEGFGHLPLNSAAFKRYPPVNTVIFV